MVVVVVVVAVVVAVVVVVVVVVVIVLAAHTVNSRSLTQVPPEKFLLSWRLLGRALHNSLEGRFRAPLKQFGVDTRQV